ncbi:MAG: hypothetical protein K0M64_09235 [Rhizobium sp.]|nr:hypothetical protein [Rhizobium sp.]
MIKLSTLVAASLLAGSAFAADSVATLSAQEGTVLVNQGEEFTTAAEAQALRAGDRVMLMEGASATITFADGCALPLVAGSLVEMPAQSPCAGAVVTMQQVGPTVAQAPGDDNKKYTVRDRKTGATYLVFGTALALIIAEISGDNYSIEPEPSASP